MIKQQMVNEDILWTRKISKDSSGNKSRIIILIGNMLTKKRKKKLTKRGTCVVHGVDSTEIANDNRFPLYTLDTGDKKVRIYNEIDCDYGARRNK